MDHYTSVSPAEVGAMSAVIGAGIGYTLAPRKYNLEQLLTQEPDVFEKSLPKNVIADSDNPVFKAAYKALERGRKILFESAKNQTNDARLAEMLNTPLYLNSYKQLKSFIPKARVQTAIVLGVIGGLIGSLAKIIFYNDN